MRARLMTKRILVAATAALGIASGAARADTVYLEDGRALQGKVIHSDDANLLIQLGEERGAAGATDAAGGSPAYARVAWEDVVLCELEDGRVLKRPQLGAAVRDDGPPPPGAPAGEDAGAEPDAKSGAGAAIAFTGTYASRLHGFQVRFPSRWSAPAQPAPGYFTFGAASGEQATLFCFDVTAFERHEATFVEVAAAAAAELDGHAGYRRLARTAAQVGGARAERTSGTYEREGACIRHEQVIVESRHGGALVFQLFAPGAGEDAVPELEAVIASIELPQ